MQCPIMFITGSLVVTFKILHVLMKTLSLLHRIGTFILFEAMKVSIKDMYFEGYSAAHFSIIFNQESQPIQHNSQLYDFQGSL